MTRELRITHPSVWGMIPAWLNSEDDAPLWEQVHKHYAHGGGWRDFEGFKVLQGSLTSGPFQIQYPGDPVYYELGRIFDVESGEILVMFESSWVLWTDENETKIARID